MIKWTLSIIEKCTGCGACVKTCPQIILELFDKKKMHVIDHDRCMSCFGCEDACNFGAVFIKKAPFLEMKESEIKVEDNGKPEPEYDVVIVGAGPSWLGTAISCAELGLKTAIFDRLLNRELCKDTSVDGAVAVGDNWVSGAQLGNINSIANGIYTGREIRKAFDRNDFSKESLSSASKFVNKDVEMFIDQIAKMFKYM